MRTRPQVIVVGLFSLLFGSCDSSRPSRLAAPEITSGSEVEGFHDLVFAIRRHEELSDGSQELEVYGVHQGQEVGLIVVLDGQWARKGGDSDTPFSACMGTVRYRSVGDASDRLAIVLDQLYGTNLHPRAMRAETVFSGFSLQGDPEDLAGGVTKIKLFFEPDSEDRYAELYTDIDIAEGVLRINEKDPEYRTAIINALSSN